MLAIAHRSGNTITGLRQALDAGVDLVEADVHAYRGGLEVRHHKTLGPAHLWDRWEIIARTELVRVGLIELLEELGDEPRLMLDLKGVLPGLPRTVANVLGTRAPDVAITICSKHWWMLDTFGPGVLPVLSASNRISLARLRRRLAAAPTYGVSVALDLVTPQLVAQLKTRADVVMTWPVDSPKALARAQRAGVDGVISKNLDLLVRIVTGQ
jgi:glycerophosphoryl diester phosphodiesterase